MQSAVMTSLNSMGIPRPFRTIIAVVIKDTVRLSWRDPLTRLEIVLLAILTFLSAIATIGSPNAGDGAIQMLAISYQVTPFSLVLIIGQLGRNRPHELLWHTRRLPRFAYLSGRFLGLLIVGLIILGLIGIEGSLLMAIIGAFPIMPSIADNFFFLLTIAAPSLVVVTGMFLWLSEWRGDGSHYFVPAIVLSLIIAFSEYKIPALEAWDPHLLFYNPFPGFLMLGLALPPALYGPIGIPSWLVINRLVWMAVGLGFFLLALMSSRTVTRFYPLTSGGKVRLGYFVLLAGFFLGLAMLHHLATELSPYPLAMTIDEQVQTRNETVTLHVNPSTGFVSGQAIMSFSQPQVGKLSVALNRGLILKGNFPLLRLNHGDVFAMSAAAQWNVRLTHPVKTLTLSFYGHLLPQPTPLVYPPFFPGNIYEHLYVGRSRVFLQSGGFWYPRLLQIHQQQAVIVSGLSKLILSEPASERLPVPVTDMDIEGSKTWIYEPNQGPLFFFQAPYRIVRHRGFDVLGPQPLSKSATRSFQSFRQAWNRLGPWLIGTQKPFIVVYSPITIHPLLWQRVLIVSAVHPYTLPGDPVTGSSQVPSPFEAAVTLDQLWWEPYPHSTVLQYETLLEAYRESSRIHSLLAEVQRGQIPGLPKLTSQEAATILNEWPHLSTLSARQWLSYAGLSPDGGL
ncbi:hypothetical protein [Sulfobacillus thermosulfidooxidans]|uniref:hypothetical protein n=1 Tax=Sulfobacillus thermosulfidooxidans TaxID=28034 RepID=UPI0006B53F7E|nr:hypothetical protein [Sulfobacillus thermosulfidooxidans]